MRPNPQYIRKILNLQSCLSNGKFANVIGHPIFKNILEFVIVSLELMCILHMFMSYDVTHMFFTFTLLSMTCPHFCKL